MVRDDERAQHVCLRPGRPRDAQRRPRRRSSPTRGWAALLPGGQGEGATGRLSQRDLERPRRPARSAVRRRAASGRRVGLDPAGFTDLSLPLAACLETAGVGEGRLLGVVLLTDGRQNVGDPPAKKALEAGRARSRFTPSPWGPKSPRRKPTILALTAPPAVHKGDAAPVDVHFRVAGLRDQDVIVELFRGAGTTEDARREAHRPPRRQGRPASRLRESYQVKMDTAGPQALTATVHPADPNVKVVRRRERRPARPWSAWRGTRPACC